MASSDRCSVCKKNRGTCICPGCKAYFCDDDFKDHRGMLVNKLDELTIGRNELHEKINNAISHNQPGSALLSKIDEWQQKTIENVKQAAEQARQQVLQIVDTKREHITRQFESISQEMKHLTDTKSVLESDLPKLKQQIDRLNENVKQLSQPPTVKLDVTESDKIIWNRMICVEEKSTSGTVSGYQKDVLQRQKNPFVIQFAMIS